MGGNSDRAGLITKEHFTCCSSTRLELSHGIAWGIMPRTTTYQFKNNTVSINHMLQEPAPKNKPHMCEFQHGMSSFDDSFGGIIAIV